MKDNTTLVPLEDKDDLIWRSFSCCEKNCEIQAFSLITLVSVQIVPRLPALRTVVRILSCGEQVSAPSGPNHLNCTRYCKKLYLKLKLTKAVKRILTAYGPRAECYCCWQLSVPGAGICLQQYCCEEAEESKILSQMSEADVFKDRCV